ncbi:mitochondrial 54S ribosomal protein mL59 NDAI_0A06810 [Naumovozyma dairenensis CBS 421]|uniref:Large ribosomal subunit protein mL59 domain-containing protein n=1 Tax=Naumovozyma dairenensis (strain ATCC 10597 / BCRC 20456 / CBS 421 / NBRC 0211 / NRRL Y-12639) TaxID=1071378 RepID=G0W4U7_NAUDC|nr:hypothetical protein NDAI_0A06810 [Naumovozyma dairenensis CBS 421]CCD22835.1 hypothetical protein NDAI_0A06810 [Naumovozyma dairenensis CBS 421]
MSTSGSLKYFNSLPIKLRTFFEKYPPSIKYAKSSTSIKSISANPFLRNRNPINGKFYEPKYSLRRMSDIYKLAHRYGVQDLLPPIPSSKLFFQEKYDKKIAENKFMKGVLFPKGHKYELALESKLKAREEGIKNADKMIADVKGKKYVNRLERKSKDKTLESNKSWF